MALGATLDASNAIYGGDQFYLTRPAGISAEYQTVIDAGGMDDADNGGSAIVNPDASITLSTRHILKINGFGTLVKARVKYRAAMTTDPVIQCFGRTNGQQWQPLENRNGDLPATFSDLVTDSTDGTDFWTTPDPDLHVWDVMGCDEILFGIKTAGAGTNIALATLEACVY